jgi:flagellar motor switch protein FliM
VLFRSILDRATESLSEAWETVRAISYSLDEIESNPQIVQIVPPNEVVVSIGFEIKMSDRAGTMTLCIPFKLIEPFIEDLGAQSWSNVGRHEAQGVAQGRMRRNLSEAQLAVNAVLAETTITVEDLRRLEVGDIITTAQPTTGPVTVTAGGIPKFEASIGQHRGKRAVRIDRVLADEGEAGAIDTARAAARRLRGGYSRLLKSRASRMTSFTASK